MQILLQNAPEDWARGLAARGHDLIRLTASGPGLRSDLRLALKSLVSAPADVSLAFMDRRSLVSPLLAGLRAPLVAHFERLEPPSLTATDRLRLQSSLQNAVAVTTSSDELAHRLQTETGLRGVRVLRPGFDLETLPLLPREEARAALGLEPRQRVAVLTGPLLDDVRVDLLALAHRKVPGLALVVVASGTQLPVVRAMTVATRPSSPVLILPEEPAALGAALGAGDLGLALAEGRFGAESELYAAAGLPQVAFPHVELEARDFVYVSPRHPTEAGLLEALEEALDGPRPAAASTSALRARLGPDRPMAEMESLLRSCASPSSSRA